MPNKNFPLLDLPPAVPRVKDHPFLQWLCRTVWRLGGWHMEGAFPNLPRAVLIGAPHSSNWDGFWGLTAKVGLGIDIRILGKDSLFKIPVLGPVLRWIGIISVERSNPAGIVEQAAQLLLGDEPFWYGLAPEGTRCKVEKWKMGFWRIAREANMPVVPVYFDYKRKVIGVGEAFQLTDDMGADMERILAWYRPRGFGRNHDI